MSSDPNSGWLEWFQILGTGSIGGFIGSLILDPIKRKIQSPNISVNFPISRYTDIQDTFTTPYIAFLMYPSEEYFMIRCILENQSWFFTAEQCRVFLTSIKTRENPEQEWKPTEYREGNQVAWSDKTSEFDAVDIFPETTKTFEPLMLYPGYPAASKVDVRIRTDHFSFKHLFPFPTQNGKGWKFFFLVTGKNVRPTHFSLTLECFWNNSAGVGFPIFHVNGCPLIRDRLITRNYRDPEEYSTEQERLQRERDSSTLIVGRDFPI